MGPGKAALPHPLILCCGPTGTGYASYGPYGCILGAVRCELPIPIGQWVRQDAGAVGKNTRPQAPVRKGLTGPGL